MRTRVIIISIMLGAVVAAAVPPDVRKWAIDLGEHILHHGVLEAAEPSMKKWVGEASAFVPLEIGFKAFFVGLQEQTVVAVQLKADGNSGWSRPVTPLGNYEFIAISPLDGSTRTNWYFGLHSYESETTSFPILLGRSPSETPVKETAVRLWISPETNGKRFRILFRTPPQKANPK